MTFTESRLWAKIEIPHGGFGCWPWKAVHNGRGYGQLRVNGHQAYAHRLAWEYVHGLIPPGQCILHRCDNPRCCNPSHLFLGTHKDTARDKARKWRTNKAKLTPGEVREIRCLLQAGAKQRDLAKRYGVDQNAIWLLKVGRTYAHVGPESTT